MIPVLRRINDVVEGEPVMVGDRVVTPVARRRGWVLATGRGAVFRINAVPHSVTVDTDGASRVVRITNWKQYVSLAGMLFVALVLVRARRRTK